MAPHDSQTDVVLAEYKEVTAQFRALMDIRFKLLTFLPLGTIAAVYLSKDGQLPNDPAVAAFAFVATLCIATYNKRNDQHYDELVAHLVQRPTVAIILECLAPAAVIVGWRLLRRQESIRAKELRRAVCSLMDQLVLFLSAIIDLPARWIADVWSGRR